MVPAPGVLQPVMTCRWGLRTCWGVGGPLLPPGLRTHGPQLPVPRATCLSFKTRLKRHLLRAGTGLPRMLPILPGSLSAVLTPKTALTHSPLTVPVPTPSFTRLRLREGGPFRVTLHKHLAQNFAHSRGLSNNSSLMS